jgi:hypothetical protein
MFKESFLDMAIILGDKIELITTDLPSNIELYECQFRTMSEKEQINMMRLFTVIVHKFDIFRPYTKISFDDVMTNPHLQTPFIICFNYFHS